jgi:hypothetical protein
MTAPITKNSPKGLPQGGNVDPPGNMFPKLVQGRNPQDRMWTQKENLPMMKISPKGCAPRERCANPRKVKTSRCTISPSLTRDNPKTTRHTPSKRYTTPDDVGPLIGLVEVEGVPLPMLKPKLRPPLENNPEVGIEGMGVGTLGILKGWS